MRALDTKMLRDLWGLRGQALAIAIVIVSGVATFVAAFGTMDALRTSRSAFYEDARFADVFAALKRAPNDVAARLRSIPGVAVVQTRVQAPARLSVPGFDEPITGRLISVPEEGQPVLNQLVVREGRLPHPGRQTEVVASEAFAEAHDLHPGDPITAIINGRRRTLVLVGVVLSPEYIYQIKPGGLFPDAQRFGVLWMPRLALAAAYDMEGAFNDAVLSLTAQAGPEDVLERVDLVLAPYGGRDAYLREDQVSHRYLSEELKQLEQLATVLPVTFLAVAAFLLNVVVGRLIRTQREEIATLKAFGYSDYAVGAHYVELVLVIVVVGSIGGVLLGARLGRGLAQLYLQFYKLPELYYALDLATVVTATGVTALAALGGTLYAVWQAVQLNPAVAMRPEPPSTYRETWVERLGLREVFDQPTRMILRHLERRPLKAVLSVVGIAASVAIVMTGTFFSDAVDYMVDVQFGRSQREDVMVTFTEPTSYDALYELVALRGVTTAEPFRSVPARLRHGYRSYRTGIEGLEPNPSLHRPLTTDLTPVDLPHAGIVLTEYLAGVLDVGPGDTLTVDVLEGARPVRTVPVAGLTRQYIGVGAYMQLDALNQLVREGRAISGAYLATDPRYRAEAVEVLTDRPRVASVEAQTRAIESFYETMGDTILTFTFIMTLFAGAIAFGVVYNSARIALAERSRELASLRVLGLTRAEIGYILLGELGLLTLLSIPVGFLIGWGLCASVAQQAQTDLFRVPLVIGRGTLAFAATVVLVAALISGGIVWRRLGRLDLIEVLKTRE